MTVLMRKLMDLAKIAFAIVVGCFVLYKIVEAIGMPEPMKTALANLHSSSIVGFQVGLISAVICVIVWLVYEEHIKKS